MANKQSPLFREAEDSGCLPEWLCAVRAASDDLRPLPPLTDVSGWTLGTGLEKYYVSITDELSDWLGYESPEETDADGRLYEIMSATALELKLQPARPEVIFTLNLAGADIRLHVERLAGAIVIGLHQQKPTQKEIAHEDRPECSPPGRDPIRASPPVPHLRCAG